MLIGSPGIWDNYINRGCGIPTYELECNACKSAFTLVLEDKDDLSHVFCPECKGEDYSCSAYDMYDNPRLFEMQKRLTELEIKVSKITGEGVLREMDLN